MSTTFSGTQTETRVAETSRPVDGTVHTQPVSTILSGGVFLLSLAGFLWLVWSLEGFDFDTVFIAIFCSVLASFVVRALTQSFLDSH